MNAAMMFACNAFKGYDKLVGCLLFSFRFDALFCGVIQFDWIEPVCMYRSVFMCANI